MISKCSDRNWLNLISPDFQSYAVEQIVKQETTQKGEKSELDELKKQIQFLQQQIDQQKLVIENNKLLIETSEKPTRKDVDKEGPFSENQMQPTDELPVNGDAPKAMNNDEYLKFIANNQLSEKELHAGFVDALQKVFVENLVEKPDAVEPHSDEEYGSEDLGNGEDEGEFTGYEEEGGTPVANEGGL